MIFETLIIIALFIFVCAIFIFIRMQIDVTNDLLKLLEDSEDVENN